MDVPGGHLGGVALIRNAKGQQIVDAALARPIGKSMDASSNSNAAGQG